jgi:hypothetical protein
MMSARGSGRLRKQKQKPRRRGGAESNQERPQPQAGQFERPPRGSADAPAHSQKHKAEGIVGNFELAQACPAFFRGSPPAASDLRASAVFFFRAPSNKA